MNARLHSRAAEGRQRLPGARPVPLNFERGAATETANALALGRQARGAATPPVNGTAPRSLLSCLRARARSFVVRAPRSLPML